MPWVPSNTSGNLVGPICADCASEGRGRFLAEACAFRRSVFPAWMSGAGHRSMGRSDPEVTLDPVQPVDYRSQPQHENAGRSAPDTRGDDSRLPV
jgi:hypothetical protein